ncbi:hypothetical protein ACA910_012082 [Epithemia clementina (nom. ined.)]
MIFLSPSVDESALMSTSSRSLYDATWIDKGCQSSHYDLATNVDHSVWTYTSCYAAAAMGITLTILLLAMSSTHQAPSSCHITSPSKRSRKVAAKEKAKIKSRLHKEKKEPEIGAPSNDRSHRFTGSAGPNSFPQIDSSRRHSPIEEPSIRSWHSKEQGETPQNSAMYLGDGTLSTDLRESLEKEAPSEPALAVLVTNPPPIITPSSQIQFGTAPLGLVPEAPPTAANSDPESNTIADEDDSPAAGTPADGRSQHQHYNDCFMTLLICYFMFLSTSTLVAGFGYMTGEDFSGQMPNRVVHGTAAFAATSLLAVAATEYIRLLLPPTRSSSLQANQQQQQPSQTTSSEALSDNSMRGNRTIYWMGTWMLCSLPVVVVFVILDSSLYTSVLLGISHFAVLLTALFRMCFCGQRHLVLWYFVDAIAMLIYLVGFLVQVFLEKPCGHDGYKDDCFANCPFSMTSSSVNHNAIFYLCVLVSLLLYGCSKMVQLQPANSNKDKRQDERPNGNLVVMASSSHPTPPVPHNHGRASGAAAAILLQDHTLEV